jgi:cell wall integrity and stress response component
MSLRHITVAAILAAASLVSAQDLQPPHEDPVRGSDKPWGCMSSLGELEVILPAPDFNSRGKCNEICRGLNKAVAATYATDCYCGDKYPPKSSMVEDSQCNEPCPGTDQEACKSRRLFTNPAQSNN